MSKQEFNMPMHFPVTCHTNCVGEGSVFVAIHGAQEDGVQYIPEAIKRGAQEIVVQEGDDVPENIMTEICDNNVRLTFVPNVREALAIMSARAAGNPAKQLKVIAVTGTKGKSTTVYLLEHLLRSAGHKTAMLSTIQNCILGDYCKSELTTPQPDYLQQFLKYCVEAGVEYVVMEVSAQALSLHRVAGILFSGIIFTNFEMEHAEFYSSIEEYFKAKCLVFDNKLSDAHIVINADDRRLHALAGRYTVNWFGFETPAQFQGAAHGNQREQVSLTVSWHDNEYNFTCPSLIGKYNAYNCLAAISMALSLGIETHTLIEGLHSFSKVPGRMELYVVPNGAKCVIDYAHTPASYEAVLSLLASFTKQLIVVFGAGGNRDCTKRPKMGALAVRYAQLVLLTSDNPRLEDPLDIINDIRSGIPDHEQEKVLCVLDREKAIRTAYEHSHDGAIIAILGKGADEYEIVGTTVTPFSEASIIRSL